VKRVPIVLIAICIVIFAITGCAPKRSFAGDWNGTVSFTNPLDNKQITVPVTFHVLGEPGAYTATFDSPTLGVTSQKVDSVTVTDDDVSIAINKLEVTYKGKSNADATEIAGTLTRAGNSVQLKLNKQLSK